MPMQLNEVGCLLEKIRNRNDMVIAPFGKSSVSEDAENSSEKIVLGMAKSLGR
jgi:hypothetical protein